MILSSDSAHACSVLHSLNYSDKSIKLLYFLHLNYLFYYEFILELNIVQRVKMWKHFRQNHIYIHVIIVVIMN